MTYQNIIDTLQHFVTCRTCCNLLKTPTFTPMPFQQFYLHFSSCLTKSLWRKYAIHFCKHQSVFMLKCHIQPQKILTDLSCHFCEVLIKSYIIFPWEGWSSSLCMAVLWHINANKHMHNVKCLWLSPSHTHIKQLILTHSDVLGLAPVLFH